MVARRRPARASSGRGQGKLQRTGSRPHPESTRQPQRRVSLHRALSKLGYASRTDALRMIAAGRVSVGHHVVRDPDWRVDLDLDPIHIDDEPTSRAAPLYWLLNKPVGYVTTRRDPQGRPTVYELLPAGLPFVAPVGRLDLQSSGLLLLSNDTQLGARQTDPESHLPKVYEVELDAPIRGADALRLERGVVILGRMTRPAVVRLTRGDPSRHALVTLYEGRNRQVRRMFEVLGRRVLLLRRIAIGPLRIDGLEEGKARPLRPLELKRLLQLERKPKRPARH